MHIYESQTLAALATALSAFQGEVEAAKKTAVNPHLKNKYADLAAIWDEIRAPLAKHGLAVVQRPVPSEDGRLHLETRLLHKSGEFIASVITMPLTKHDPQGYGSALTYSRRYGLAAMLGITQEDDDAEGAVSRAPAKATTEKPAARQVSKAPAPAEAAPEPEITEEEARNRKRIKDAAREYGVTWEMLASMAKRVCKKTVPEVAMSDDDTERLLKEITMPAPAAL